MGEVGDQRYYPLENLMEAMALWMCNDFLISQYLGWPMKVKRIGERERKAVERLVCRVSRCPKREGGIALTVHLRPHVD